MEKKVDSKPRGFAAMDPELVKSIASKGGKAAHAAGTAHSYVKGSELARESGRKGGRAVHLKLQAIKAAKEAELAKKEVA